MVLETQKETTRHNKNGIFNLSIEYFHFKPHSFLIHGSYAIGDGGGGCGQRGGDGSRGGANHTTKGTTRHKKNKKKHNMMYCGMKNKKQIWYEMKTERI